MNSISMINEKINRGETYLQVINNCKRCNGTGYIKQDYIKPDNDNPFYKLLPDYYIDNCSCIVNGITLVEAQKKLDYYRRAKDMLTVNIPEKYLTMDLNVNTKLIEFMKLNDNFIWICGNIGSGKTTSIYQLSQYLIIESLKKIDIITENELSYDTELRRVMCIDDVGIKIKNQDRYRTLTEYYFNVIDEAEKMNKKIIFTSNISFFEWVTKMKQIEPDNAARIFSRMNKIKTIELLESDKRI